MYLWIGYALTWVAVALYAWRLEARAREATRRTKGYRASGASTRRSDASADLPGREGSPNHSFEA